MRIPIAAAAFCEDCQSFGDNLIVCECGSQALLTMSTVMNRQEEPEYFPRLRLANDAIRDGRMNPEQARTYFCLEGKVVILKDGEVIE